MSVQATRAGWYDLRRKPTPLPLSSDPSLSRLVTRRLSSRLPRWPPPRQRQMQRPRAPNQMIHSRWRPAPASHARSVLSAVGPPAPGRAPLVIVKLYHLPVRKIRHTGNLELAVLLKALDLNRITRGRRESHLQGEG